MLSTCLQPPHKLSSSHAWCVLVLVLAKRCFANASGSTCSLQSANHVCMHICMASLSTSPLIEHGRLCVEKLTAISSALVYVIPETDYYTEDAACVCLQVALFFVIGCLLAIRGSTGVVATYPSKARTVPFVLPYRQLLCACLSTVTFGTAWLSGVPFQSMHVLKTAFVLFREKNTSPSCQRPHHSFSEPSDSFNGVKTSLGCPAATILDGGCQVLLPGLSARIWQPAHPVLAGLVCTHGPTISQGHSAAGQAKKHRPSSRQQQQGQGKGHRSWAVQKFRR